MSEHLPGPGATAAPAAERAEPAAGHRACLGTAAGPPSAAVPVPRALFSQKGIFWLLGAALPGQGKRPGKKKYVCKQRYCCGRQSARRSSPGSTPQCVERCCSAFPHTVDSRPARLALRPTLGGLASLPEPAEHQLSQDGAAGVVREPGLAGQGGHCSAGG